MTILLGKGDGIMEKTAYEIEEITISDIQQAFKNGELTSVELVQAYLDRIEQFDKNGPKINSVLSINPNALKIAAELDEMRGQEGQGPLYGIPVLLKDNIDTVDAMPTTAGTVALKENFARKDAFVAAQLRNAGAIILGKVNMSEWAYFMTENVPSGFSNLSGQVLNPYGVGVFEAGSVGGSSSGTGAAIASNFAVVGIGTETSGSILSPSSANSLVGIKPTVGLISRTGIIPIAESQDTAGPMARTVADAAITLGVLTGVDEEDPATLLNDTNALADYTPHLKADGLQGARIGVDRAFLSEIGKEERDLMERVVIELAELGAEIIDVEIPQVDARSEVLWYEFKRGVNAYLSKVPSDVPVKSLEDVIAFNKEKPEERMKYGQVELEKAQALSDDPKDPTYVFHRETDIRISRREGIDAVMAEHNLDALLFENNRGAALPAKAGYPSITVPAGYTSTGLPLGATFSAKAYSEPRLIELAYSYEQATKKRKAPVFE
ncbi:Glutamyl-tRNA(Gln) amidotransferase subunit A [Planococcus massiliensis]|uniref:Glutamyl-tRNA(Gln) amidotransferase subunit A n=2 Tax=Planococcus massiliensis TaxID=1499687 RepID=A0A098EJT1_9BACL|nr:Glutamyl-tRNA(Gln) amidotransferase subunit A [Planococcus massiliensis]